MPTTDETFLTQRNNFPLDLAPAELLESLAEYDKATDAKWDAAQAVEDAEHAVREAEQAWETAAEAAVRADKPLPPKTDIERAEIALTIAQKDRIPKEVAGDRAQLARPLWKESVRTEWRENISARAAELRAEILTEMKVTQPKVAELERLIGVTEYLGRYPYIRQPSYSIRPKNNGTEPNFYSMVQAVEDAAPWTPPEPETTGTVTNPSGSVSIDPLAIRGKTTSHV